MMSTELEDREGQGEQLGGRLRDGPGRLGRGETKRLFGVSIQREEGLSHFGWF